MNNLYSIQSSDKIFETDGSRPILITCNNFDSYVCKYNLNTGSSYRLFCEYIGASFLKLWDLSIPEFVFVKVSKEHIPNNFNIRNINNFNTTCFGLKHSRSFDEVNNFNDNIPTNKKNLYINKNDILLISLFDIWLCNEDRNFNNYNILVDIINNRNFIPIDHEAIFNTRIFNNQLSLLTYNESLLSSQLVKSLFNKKDFDKKFCSDLKETFFENVKLCSNNFVSIINKIPDDWKIDAKFTEQKIFSDIFSKNWLSKSFNLFLEFLQINNNNK